MPAIENSHFGRKVFDSLVLLMASLNVACSVLLSTYSQKTLKESYSVTEFLVVSEILKLFISSFMIWFGNEEFEILSFRYFMKSSFPIIILVVLYALVNILSFYTVRITGATLYSVCLQLRIVTTAGFSMWLLKRQISGQKWRSLIILIVGCVLVSHVNDTCETGRRKLIDQRQFLPLYEYSPRFLLESEKVPFTNEMPESTDLFSYIVSSPIISGALLMAIIVFSGGFSNVYLESIMKNSEEDSQSIWQKNFRLAFFSSLGLLIVNLYENLSQTGFAQSTPITFFENWSHITWLLLALQVAGGFLVAVTLKYTDALRKVLSASFGMVLTALGSWMFQAESLSTINISGIICVIVAISNYTLDK